MSSAIGFATAMDLHRHDGAAARLSLHGQVTAQQACPFRHSGQSEAVPAQLVICFGAAVYRREAGTDITDRKHHAVHGSLHADARLRGLRMFDDVVQRLLYDAVEIDPQRLRKDVVYVIEVRGEAGCGRAEAVRIMPSMALLNPSRSNWKGLKL
jgi:hypothetical protein